MNGDDVRPWSPFVKECVVNLIRHGADRSGETVLIKSRWKSWLDLLEHWVSVRRRLLLTFLRKPWNPLSCNSITIPLGGGEALLSPPDDCRSLYIGTWGHQRWTGLSQSHIWRTKVSFHTWTATGRKKSKFNYQDSIYKHIQTHKNLIHTHTHT